MIEVVRGTSSSDALLDGGAPPSSEAVCVVRLDGAVAGFSSVHPEAVDLIGGRRFWIYRDELAEGADVRHRDLFRATFRALDAEFDQASGAPIGLCAFLPPGAAAARPEVEWLDPRTFYAGYLEDGRQVRIAYFTDASIDADARPRPSPDWRLRAGYHVEPFNAGDAVKANDVVGLWLREGALSYAEAKRRLAEVLLVATDPDQRPVGVCTAYLKRNERLRADLWHYRLFVAAAHRKSSVASALAFDACAYLGNRFVTGEDTRAIGILYEIENEFLKRAFTMAVWERVDFAFIGENARGAHMRVHYFPGALAPGPEAASA